MPDNIQQKLGMDVSEALAALDQVDAKFAAFGTQLGVAVGQISAFNASAAGIVAALQKISTQAGATSSALAGMSGSRSIDSMLGVSKVAENAKAMQDTMRYIATGGTALAEVGSQAKSASDAVNQTTRSTAGLTLSWQTFARIVQTQALIRGINMIRDAYAEAYHSAMDFDKQVAEIAAINPERNFQEIAASVREMSDAFNQPISQVAEGQYQLLSSQFTTAADRVNILTAANQLSKVSAQDFSAVTLLLVGALNAYGESSDRAGLRAGQFFQAIKDGRLRAAELGTALGRIEGIGHELGMSLEEMNSAMVSISIGGVKATEAGTQLRGMISALLKPSQEMKDALKNIGVESGPAAVATWGFQGAWAKLVESVGGDQSKIAQLDPNIRGMAGAFRLAGSGAKIYNDELAKQSKVNQNTLLDPLAAFQKTDFAKVTDATNKLKNFFTADLGQTIVESLAKASGGIDGVINTLRTLTDLTGAATRGFAELAKGVTLLLTMGASSIVHVSDAP